MSPLKNRVMSSTKITPWQEVKSNCRDGAGVSLRRMARHPRRPSWAVCWPEGGGLHSRLLPRAPP